MGLTAAGYVRRTYEDILNDKIQKAKELFGENIDTGDLTPLGKFIRINAYDQAIAEEKIEAVYYARFPNTAFGQSLDRLLPFAAITRNQAEAALYKVQIQGTAGYTIETGFLVGTDSGLTFYTIEDAIIGEDGTSMIMVCCTESGTVGNINASTINTAVNPSADIEAVKGLECVSAGKDAESDADLRVRFKESVSGAGSCNANAIRAALLRIPTVKFAAVVENEEDTEDEEGRPPHSFQCYVLGGIGYEQEIAEAIFEKRPIGVKTVGDKEIAIIDASGNERVVKYSSTQNVNITVAITMRTTALYPGDGAERIQAGVANYINSLGIGNSLVHSALYGPIYSIPGVAEVTALRLSTDGGSTYTTDNVDVPKYGIAVCSEVNVEVVT